MSTHGDPPLFYDTHVFVCLNEREPGHPRGCCLEKGAEELQAYMKAKARELGLKKVRINKAGCLDRCELGPVMVVYPNETWYTYVDKSDVDEIVEEHLKNGRVVERLKI